MRKVDSRAKKPFHTHAHTQHTRLRARRDPCASRSTSNTSHALSPPVPLPQMPGFRRLWVEPMTLPGRVRPVGTRAGLQRPGSHTWNRVSAGRMFCWPFCGSLGPGSEHPPVGLLKGTRAGLTALLFQTTLQNQQKTEKRGLGVACITCPDTPTSSPRAHACARAHFLQTKANRLRPGELSPAPPAGVF